MCTGYGIKDYAADVEAQFQALSDSLGTLSRSVTAQRALLQRIVVGGGLEEQMPVVEVRDLLSGVLQQVDSLDAAFHEAWEALVDDDDLMPTAIGAESADVADNEP